MIKLMNQKLREMEGGRKGMLKIMRVTEQKYLKQKGTRIVKIRKIREVINISKQTKDYEVTAVEKIKKFQIKIKTKTIVKLVLWRMRIKQLWK